jgi:ketosteroid isomerase-like protein
MTPPRLIPALLAASILAACGAGGPDPAAEEARLMETSRAWSRAAAAGEVDAILDYWADNALVIPPGEPPLRGKPAIRAYLERSMKTPGFRISWEPLEASVSADGGMGYLVERTRVTVNGPDGRPVVQHFRGVTVWRKQPDGAWKNVVDITNAPPPPGRR